MPAAIPGRTAEFAAAFGIPATSSRYYAALLASPDIDAVYIPLPNSLHAGMVDPRRRNAGKAVLCEKPLALDAAEAAAPVVEHFAAKKRAADGRLHVPLPSAESACAEADADGAIGDVREVRAHLSVDIMDPPDPGNIRFNQKLGGGRLLDMGCYAISIARRFFGEEPRRGVGSSRHRSRRPASISRQRQSSNSPVAAPPGVLVLQGRRARASTRSSARRATIDVPRAFIPGMGSRVAEGLVIVVDRRRTADRNDVSSRSTTTG